MSCDKCPYLNNVEIEDGGRMNCCNAHILEDGNGHPMMSIYAKHDWCPILNAVMEEGGLND